MGSSRNVIRRTEFDFHYIGHTDAMKLQQEVTGWCRNTLASCLDSALVGYEKNEEVISVDKITLEIDLENTGDWQKYLAEKIIRQFNEKLRFKIDSRKDGVVEIKSHTASFVEILHYYLKFGVLPWNSTILSGNGIKTELEIWVGKATATEITGLLLSLDDKNQVKRLTRILTQEDFESILASVTNESKSIISSFFNDVSIILNAVTKDKNQQYGLLEELKEMIITGFAAQLPQSPGASVFQYIIIPTIKQWISSMEHHYPGQVNKTAVRIIKNDSVRKMVREIQTTFRQVRHQEVEGKAMVPGQISEKGEIKEVGGKEIVNRGDQASDLEILGKAIDHQMAEGRFDAEEDLKKNKPGSLTHDEFINELAKGVFISNAGVIIIASFFSTLFSRAGLIKENEITDTPTALSLIHYCITGKTGPSEIEQLLPKILCGIEPEQSIDAKSIIDEKLLEEADDMLASVIEHWAILKATSINGLREAFLQRNGKLCFKDNEWLLNVEVKPHDMLLEQLPWNITLIKLPWMKNRLITQWIV